MELPDEPPSSFVIHATTDEDAFLKNPLGSMNHPQNW
jgi:hypothetical protein